MSLDIYFNDPTATYEGDHLHWQNITHNLGEMADMAGIYNCLWRPEENGINTAGELIPLLEKAIKDMEDRPEYYKQFDADNGWGVYDDFLPWLRRLLEKAKEYPLATIRVSR